MPRRKRVVDDGLNLPAGLLPAAVRNDPSGWRDRRFEWSRIHDWGAQKIGFLAFFDETVCLYRGALGLEMPAGSAERYAQRQADAQ